LGLALELTPTYFRVSVGPPGGSVALQMTVPAPAERTIGHWGTHACGTASKRVSVLAATLTT